MTLIVRSGRYFNLRAMGFILIASKLNLGERKTKQLLETDANIGVANK